MYGNEPGTVENDHGSVIGWWTRGRSPEWEEERQETRRWFPGINFTFRTEYSGERDSGGPFTFEECSYVPERTGQMEGSK